jgi:hypothetical protein
VAEPALIDVARLQHAPDLRSRRSNTSAPRAPRVLTRRAPRGLIAAACLVVAACAPAPAPPLDHAAYVWQRQWTPAVAAAVTDRSADFSGLRVLALQQTATARVATSPDLAALSARGVPVRVVLRMEGSRPRADAAELGLTLAGIVQRWRAAGVRVDGVEVDHDCASAGLAEYAAWLPRFRASLPADLLLSITALPSWLDNPAELALLRAAADESVLQVHALDATRLALFNRADALRSARAWQAQAPQPFRVALPAYSLRVQLAADGRTLAVDAEGGLGASGAGARERHADPAEVAGLVRTLQNEAMPALRGLLWFRLPVQGDRRSWAPATLAAVMRGDAPPSRIALQYIDRGGGLYDLALHNPADTDARAPALLELPAHCGVIEGLGGYRRQPGTTTLHSPDPPWMKPMASLALGFARCGPIEPAR